MEPIPDAESIVGDEIHPLFNMDNFITDLPMDEVREQMTLALTLASKSITNDRALEWFSRVRFHASTPYANGVRILRDYPHSNIIDPERVK